MREAQYDLHAEIEDRHWWFLGRRAIVKRVLERVVPLNRESLVIDVGCGTGANVAALSASYRCLGLDASAHAIELARKRFADVEYACDADLSAHSERFGSAAAVLLMDVLEHVEDDFAMLSQVLAALRPGAHVLITVPADPALWTRHDESFGHWRRYELERLRSTWLGLPVEERLISHYNVRLYPIIKAVRTFTKHRGRAAGASDTDFSMPPGIVNRCLTRLFAGEARALCRSIDREPVAGARGASLIAILRRLDAPIAPRTKPAGLLPDHFRPS